MGKRQTRKVQVIGQLAFVPLTQGRAAMIDAADALLASSRNWHLHKCPRTSYAQSGSRENKALLHRIIMGLRPRDGLEVDHINGNGLDCRRTNMRVCCPAQNRHNQRPQKDCSSPYKGVCWHQASRLWRANIRVGGKRIWLGAFRDETEAARAYDAAAKTYFGEFSQCNF